MAETDLLKSLGEIAGIGGIAVGVALFLLRDIIAKALRVESEKAYRLLRLIAIFAFTIGLVGMGVWGFSGSGNQTATHGPTSPIVKDTKGPVTVNINSNAGPQKPDPTPGPKTQDRDHAGSGQKTGGDTTTTYGAQSPVVQGTSGSVNISIGSGKDK